MSRPPRAEANHFLTHGDELAVARARGVRDPELARTYLEVELMLAEDQDRDPRQAVVAELNRTIHDPPGPPVPLPRPVPSTPSSAAYVDADGVEHPPNSWPDRAGAHL